MNLSNLAGDPTGKQPLETHEGYQVLAELALNIRWSWNHATDEVWRKLNPELWEITDNPWVVLQTASRQQIEQLWEDGEFRKSVESLIGIRREALAAPAWFQEAHKDSPLTCAAYFSMEFMLSEALPIYSGGLGNVAGDQLKSTSDLGVPVVGVGLLYQQGYFRQVISKDGSQEALFPYNDPGQMPVTPMRQEDGEWLRLKIDVPGSSIWVRVWQVRVGKVNLYLLDTNDPANLPIHRGITSELYGGGPELRLQQELLLGICGWRVLCALGLEPEVCHLNEGHAAFAVLERARTYMEKTGQPFDVALAVTRAGNLFTTHTAVAAGFDRFPPLLIERYLGNYAEKKLGISRGELLAMGRKDPNDSSEPFNMAYLAIRGSGAVSAVSRLHEEVSKEIFGPLFPRWPIEGVPVGHVTNGVHVSTWASPQADKLWTEAIGKDRWQATDQTVKDGLDSLPDTKLWGCRNEATAELVEYTRKRLSRELAAAGISESEAEKIFHPNALVLGFARRFASYKRPNLLLHDRDRLLRILSNPDRPVQLVIAGKAHPQDEGGQDLIREWISFIRQPNVRPYIAFLSDYDMMLTQHLVQGVDVWINTPRRPWEASGTSGMKVLVNGGINLSELDGWWAEAYIPEVGWAIGDGLEHGDDPAWDAAEAQALYDLLENHVIPEFYDRDENGIPKSWLTRVRASMSQLTSQFSADRAVTEYTEKFYIPAAAGYRARSADNGAVGKQVLAWTKEVDEHWSDLGFGEVKIQLNGDQNEFEASVFLQGLNPTCIRVELYAIGLAGGPPEVVEMNLIGESGDPSIYRCAVSAVRPSSDYTVRIIPALDGASVPLESSKIMWQR